MPDSDHTLSVIIRVKNKVAVIGRAIESVRAQTVSAEVVVVDSGSTDGTLDVVQLLADRLVHMAPADFTFGGALNRGAEVSTGSVHVALSSHCYLPHDRWLERVLTIMSDERIGAASGRRFRADGTKLDAPLQLDAHALRLNPRWSISNHASAWRAGVWREFPFDEQLTASEDLVFARQITEAGWQVVIDPELFVPSRHRDDAGLRALFRRKRLEVDATARALDLPPFGAREAVQWWRQDVARSAGGLALALRPRRLAALMGVMAGYRDAGRLGHRR